MDILPSQPDAQQIHNLHSMGKEYLDNLTINNALCSLTNRMGIRDCRPDYHNLDQVWLGIYTIPENTGLLPDNNGLHHIPQLGHSMGKELSVSRRISKGIIYFLESKSN